MTRYGYTGPATLIIGGNELRITARISVESEVVNGFTSRQWTADLTFHPFKPPNEDTPCTLRLPDGREGSGHLPAGETRMVGAGLPPTALPAPDRADDIEVHAVDGRGEHITRIIPGAPLATDHTFIPTAELVALRHRAERAEAAIVRALAAIHTTGPGPTDWQRGWRACADHATRALNGKTETQP